MAAKTIADQEDLKMLKVGFERKFIYTEFFLGCT